METKDDAIDSNKGLDETTYLSVGDASLRSEDSSNQENQSERDKNADDSSENRKSHKKKSHTKDKKKKKSVTIDKPKLNKSEIICVTSVDEKNQTFYGQLAKFSDEELRIFGEKVHSSIEELFKKKGATVKTKSGQFVGALFSDGKWYRAIIVEKSNTNKVAMVQFIDWGNSELVEYEKIVEGVEELDILRESFGVTFKYLATPSANAEQLKAIFENLNNKYLIVKPKEEINGVWEVDIPVIGYNSHFWVKAPAAWALVPKSEINDDLLSALQNNKRFIKCQN